MTSTAIVQRVPAQRSTESGHWIGRVAMSRTEVSVTWSEVAGNDVTYRLFRFESAGLDPGTVELAGPIAELVGTVRFDDTSVEPDTFYTYVLQVIADGTVLDRRWTSVLSSNDTTPPTTVTDLAAATSTDGVLLSWAPSTDDVEFASYAVFRVDLGAEPLYLGGGADESLTSFFDDDPEPSPSGGPAIYRVVAVDFHDNRSAPADIEVALDR